MDPADIGPLCFALRSRMAARAVSRAYNDRLRPLNLQVTQFSLLVGIRLAVGVPVAALAGHLDIEPSALLRNIRILEARGLVAGDGGRGRHGRRVRLTVAGEALLAQATPLWASAQAEMEAAVGKDFAVIRDALGRIQAAALRLEAAAP